MIGLSVAAIAACCGKTRKSIYRYATGGQLGPVTRTRNGIQLRQDAVERFFKAPFKPEIAKDAPTRGRPSKAAVSASSTTINLDAETFNREEVRELLERCAKQRDNDWSIWALDPLTRAQLPAGPGPLDFTDLQTPMIK